MTASLPQDGRVARCPHCETVIDGSVDRFCCSGCEAASALLHDLGLDDWYTSRATAAGRPEPSTHDWGRVPTLSDETGARVRLAIDGLHCSSCTWVVERVLERTPGVHSAHVSYASGRATIGFDPAVIDLESIASRVASVGYPPRPIDAASGPNPLFTHLGVALFCTANLMLLTAGVYASWSDGMEARYLVLFRWLALALATPVALFAAAPFWKGAAEGISAGRPGMDLPIALAVGVLYVHGVVSTLVGSEGYLDSLGMLVSLLLVGRILEARGRASAADAAAAIAAHLPQSARRRTPDGFEEVAPDVLVAGDVLELGPGAEVAADARVLEGSFRVQTQMLTGESAPRAVGAGELLLAGSSIVEGSGCAEVERSGAQTVAMGMAEALREAIDRPTAVSRADRLAPTFTLVTLGVAIAAGAVWTWVRGPATGVQVAVAVLVVACPCALGLSTPLALSNGLGALARRGLLLRNGDALLRLAEIEQVAVDKTGTLTVGEVEVRRATDAVLQAAAGLERTSHHPIARAICREAVARGLPLPLATELEETAGVGVAGAWRDHRWSLRSGGAGTVLLYRDGQIEGSIELGDRVRDSASASVVALQQQGLAVTLISGDHPEEAQRVAELLRIDSWHAAQLPQDKAEWVEDHPHTLFIGDGLNDGSALSSAHVGLAMHTGVSAALGIADGVIATGDLRAAWLGIEGSKATHAAIRQNLRRSLIYNAVAVTAAALGWVNPLVAAVLMPLSSAMVLLGSRSIERHLAAVET